MTKWYFLGCLLLLSALWTPNIQGWGNTGHRITAQIAQKHLTPKAAAAVKDLLDGLNLPQVATWADDKRSDPNYKKADSWHYMTLADGQAYAPPADERDGSLYERLQGFEKQLRDPTLPKAERAEALRWLVHLIGDAHQPLHVGKPGDFGGNAVSVLWFEELTNLHMVWDSKMIDGEELSYTEFSDLLLAELKPADKTQWSNGDYLDWIGESQKMRVQVYQTGKRNLPKLGYEYSYQNMPLVKQRLTQGGLRLAAKLNDIYK